MPFKLKSKAKVAEIRDLFILTVPTEGHCNSSEEQLRSELSQLVPHLKQVCTPEHSLSSPALPIPSSLSSSAVEKGVETSHGGFQTVRVQLGCEDGVQHCSFCIQIKDINSSGKSEPLASLVGFTNVKHAGISTAYGERSCRSALLYWCSCLCCHR